MTHISKRIEAVSKNVLNRYRQVRNLNEPFSTCYTIRLHEVEPILNSNCKKHNVNPESIIKILDIKL